MLVRKARIKFHSAFHRFKPVGLRFEDTSKKSWKWIIVTEAGLEKHQAFARRQDFRFIIRAN